MVKWIYAILAVSFILAGCGPPVFEGSSTTTTQAIRPNIVVTSTGTGETTVHVSLIKGNTQQLQLDSGDSLLVLADGQQKGFQEKITRQLGGGSLSYEAVFNDTKREYIISLWREGEGNNAPGSKVILPEGFQITGPATNMTVALDDTVTVSWTPDARSGEMHISFSGECRQTGQPGISLKLPLADSYADTGSITYQIADLLKDTQIVQGGNCTLTFTLARQSQGTLDPNFDPGGWIVAQQVRTVTVRFAVPAAPTSELNSGE